MSSVRPIIGLTFDDVLLKPQKSIVSSRDEVDLTTKVWECDYLTIPIISSPMETVTEAEMASAMSDAGGVGFIHRFMTVKEQIEEYKKVTVRTGERSVVTSGWAGCAVGVSEGYARLEELYAAGCRLFAVDVAHGYSDLMEKFVGGLDNEIKHLCTFISGSVSTPEGAKHAAELGMAAIRVGIGNGSACSTRQVTGFGTPQLTALMDCVEAVEGMETATHNPIRVIACGGIRNSGDIVKALAAGANSVMLGNLLAGCDESPKPGEYRGSAFRSRYSEGVSGKVKRTGKLSDVIGNLLEGIRSGVSYGGGKRIKDLQEKAAFQIVTEASRAEGLTRI